MKEILDMYITKANELLARLGPMQKTDEIFEDIHNLVAKMQNEAETTKDEMLYPTLFNAAATIATAPEGCSVRQLSEALKDAVAEMEAMKEYMKTGCP